MRQVTTTQIKRSTSVFLTEYELELLLKLLRVLPLDAEDVGIHQSSTEEGDAVFEVRYVPTPLGEVIPATVIHETTVNDPAKGGRAYE